jgi:hypothetical protein
MTKLWIPLLLAPASTWAQSAIAPPQLGFVEDAAHALRPLYGMAGSFVLGPSVAAGVVSEAFSGTLGLLKTESALVAFDSEGKPLGSVSVGGGPAFFAFSPNGSAALAYIVSDSALVSWRGSAFETCSFGRQGTRTDHVLAIALPNPAEASLIVERGDTLWRQQIPLVARGTFSQSALIGVRAPLLELPTGDLVYSDDDGIVVRRPDASEAHIAASLPRSFSLQQMNQAWAQLADLASSARFAIRVTAGHEGYYRLPESGQ